MNMRKRSFASFLFIKGLLICLFLTCFSSCEIINPSEPIPSYIHIDSVSLITDYNTEGSSTNYFTDAWVYVNGIYLGAFEFPFTVPVLAEGLNKISIRAGIQENGISGSRSAYSKLLTYDTSINLEANKTFTIQPVVSYLPGTEFVQLEDFDDGSLFLVPTTANTSVFNITPGGDPDAYEGNSGHIQMDVNHPLFEYATATAFTLPTTTPVFVELNYKCSQEFTVGVFVASSSGLLQSPVLNLRATSDWKKVYINLSSGGGIFTNAINYKIYLKSTLPAGISNADIYLDNLKVLY
ncbi:MAG TPA: hypothetical protein PKJ62_04065 [Bacteroidia bacterium]|nr:hypothetical protein [Bacteroidia bacterium]